jgi:hypothetical protein
LLHIHPAAPSPTLRYTMAMKTRHIITSWASKSGASSRIRPLTCSRARSYRTAQWSLCLTIVHCCHTVTCCSLCPVGVLFISGPFQRISIKLLPLYPCHISGGLNSLSTSIHCIRIIQQIQIRDLQLHKRRVRWRPTPVLWVLCLSHSGSCTRIRFSSNPPLP